jgi:hypothetical protein
MSLCGCVVLYNPWVVSGNENNIGLMDCCDYKSSIGLTLKCQHRITNEESFVVSIIKENIESWSVLVLAYRCGS